jgi:hypothetical protein
VKEDRFSFRFRGQQSQRPLPGQAARL